MTQDEIRREVALILRHLGVSERPTNASVSPPPVFHCYWCGAPLKHPAKACRAHLDLEEMHSREVL